MTHDDTLPSPARRWAILVCALVAAMTATAATSGFAYAIPELHTGGMSLSTAGTLAAIPTVGITVSLVAWGAALDRFGERRVLILSLLVTLLGTAGAAVAVATGAGHLALGAALLIGGLGSGAANGASGRIVVGFFPANQRGTAMGIRQMAQPLGIAVLAMTMPPIAAHAGAGWAMAVPVVVTVIGLIATLAGIHDPVLPPSTLDAAPGTNPYRASSYLWRIHAASLLLVIGQSMLWTFAPAWLIIGHGWSPVSAGLIVTASQVVAAFGRIVAGRVSDVWGSRMKPIRVIAVLAATALGLLALTDELHSAAAVAIMVAATVFTVADNGLAFTAIAEAAGAAWSGRALGLQNTAQYLTMSATTPVFGRLIDHAGYPLVFAISAVAPLLALPIVPGDPRPEPAEQRVV
ncbi:MAG: MFS transporter [Gordonia sp. (in: high G+C Gram-positive bacteria)]|uniref:MFS transporter n=1 Tax=Gordonia sp. (in: high G+C Gram-positive bacteria) TaxID=84139 RepID=UPI0039E6F42F